MYVLNAMDFEQIILFIQNESLLNFIERGRLSIPKLVYII